EIQKEMTVLELGKAEIVAEIKANSDEQITVLAFGSRVMVAPKDENECRQMLHTAYAYNGPAAVRYPRGAGVGVEIQKEMTVLELGKAEIVAEIKANSDEQITVLA
ncbi:hypothetical protein, partial [Streptococcus agalactiae]|uniref:hypothetical protein n=1 Tax=Streptococcus agalactiae TaxID=1311 RepID=UPI001C60BEFA